MYRRLHTHTRTLMNARLHGSMQRERESRQERAAPAIPHGLDEARLRRTFDAHSDLAAAEGEKRMNKACLASLMRAKGLAHGDAEVGRVLERRVDANGDGEIDFGEFCAAVKVLHRDRLRSRELASLLAFLGETAGEAPPHVEAESAEECNSRSATSPPRPVPVVDARGAGLERLYAWGVTKQRARNCKAQSSVEQAVGMQIACHLALSFPAVFSRDAPARQAEDPGVCPGCTHVVNVTHSMTHSSDVPWHTHSRPAWAGTGGVPISRENENDRAVREEIGAANSRRHMMRERAPLPKSALVLGASDDPMSPMSVVMGGVLADNWAAKDRGGRRASEGGEARGREAWGRGVVVNQGGMWRLQANPPRTNARTNAAVASASYATYVQPPGGQRMQAKQEVEQMSGDDLQPQMNTWSIHTSP